MFATVFKFCCCHAFCIYCEICILTKKKMQTSPNFWGTELWYETNKKLHNFCLERTNITEFVKHLSSSHPYQVLSFYQLGKKLEREIRKSIFNKNLFFPHINIVCKGLCIWQKTWPDSTLAQEIKGNFFFLDSKQFLEFTRTLTFVSKSFVQNFSSFLK